MLRRYDSRRDRYDRDENDRALAASNEDANALNFALTQVTGALRDSLDFLLAVERFRAIGGQSPTLSAPQLNAIAGSRRTLLAGSATLLALLCGRLGEQPPNWLVNMPAGSALAVLPTGARRRRKVESTDDMLDLSEKESLIERRPSREVPRLGSDRNPVFDEDDEGDAQTAEH